VSNVETRARIEDAVGPMTPLPPSHFAEESVNFRPPGGRGVVGFISPVSAPYCGSCNRMRLTADGKFHLCLLNDDEVDVRSAIRGDGGLPAVQRLLEQAVWMKPKGHQLDAGATTERRIMYQIGG
jgi:cyclic pyranopterin phosphate synthase